MEIEEVRKVGYPKDFSTEDNENNWFSFGNGVKLSDEKVENMVNDCIKSVVKQFNGGDDSPFSYCATGDTFVIAFFSEEDPHNFNNNTIEVIVAKNYDSGSFTIRDLKPYKPSLYDLKQFITKLTDEERNDLRKALED